MLEPLFPDNYLNYLYDEAMAQVPGRTATPTEQGITKSTPQATIAVSDSDEEAKPPKKNRRNDTTPSQLGHQRS